MGAKAEDAHYSELDLMGDGRERGVRVASVMIIARVPQPEPAPPPKNPGHPLPGPVPVPSPTPEPGQVPPANPIPMKR